jgi:3-isopropylmalate/(R)-2-methylmalate dehydratase small subunit
MAKFSAFSSKAVVIAADNIDTDQIIPARFLKTISKEGLGDQLFYDWRYDAAGAPKPDFVLNQEWARSRQILLAGDNFGCGSSREHAPWALTQYGFRAVISTSFADIFKNNALKNALLPIAVDPQTHRALLALGADAELPIDLESQSLTLPDGSRTAFEVDPFAKYLLLEGVDELGFILQQEDAIAAYEASRPGTLNTLAA